MDHPEKSTVEYAESSEMTTPTEIGDIIGEIPWPKIAAQVEKHRTNSSANPKLSYGDVDIENVSLDYEATGHAQFAALYGILKTTKFFRFTTETGDAYVFEGSLQAIQPISGSVGKTTKGTLEFVFTYMASHTAAA